MPGQRISELPSLANSAIAGDDLIPIVDTSAGITKRVTFADFQSAIKFPSRSAMILQASVLQTMCPEGAIVSDGEHLYKKVNGSTAISDFEDFVPYGQAYFGHWGAVGTATTAADDIRVVTVPTVDETTKLQEALNWCLVNGVDLKGRVNRIYGITAPIHWAEADGVVPIGKPELSDVNICAIGGTWVSGDISSADADDFTYGLPMLYVGRRTSANTNKLAMAVKNINVNGNRIATTGIWFRGSATALHEDVNAYQCKDCDVRVGENGNSDASCTDTVFVQMKVLGWLFSSDPANAYNDLSLRNEVGLSQESADTVYVGCTIAAAKYSLVARQFFNCQFSACKFWNGPVRTDPNSTTVIVSKSANVYQFTGCRFDDGQVRVESFNGQFVGNRFIQFGSGHLRLVATQANETASTFVFVGNRFSTGANSATLETRGGSWSEYAGVCQGNRGNTGIYTIGGVGVPRFTLSGNNIGLGVATPTARLHVAGGSTDADSRIRVDRSSDDTLGGRFSFYKSRGSPTAPTAVTANDNLGILYFYGHDGTNYLDSASIIGRAFENPTAGSAPGVLLFNVAPSGSPNLTEVMRVDPNGVRVTGNFTVRGHATWYLSATIADDTVLTITPTGVLGGVLHMKCQGGTSRILPQWSCDIAYSADTVATAEKSTAFASRGANVSVQNGGTLTGTTGTDGNVTVSPQLNGTIQIENRSGASRTFNFFAR